MDKRLLAHEQLILDSLNTTESLAHAENLYVYHTKMLANFQAERIVHLLVTLFIALFTIIFTIATAITQNVLFAPISVLLLFLLFPYILHYYNLENTIQRLYALDKVIIERIFELE
ncbi:hypothetical protein GYA27_00630 [candidate division WWE3 bacterium]|uniref:Uncharacterized protein n=1 Tax=candidate division WWE3 bacterium TaxID=2053526 RepID=A0A7X9DJN5_UNCKA|nr:hypothetical protein [candidate division WWE3 bacterium]